MQLTAVEAYALARVLDGHWVEKDLPLSSRVKNAIEKLASLPQRERLFVAPQYLTTAELRQAQLTNPLDKPPVETIELLTTNQLMNLPPINWVIKPEIPSGMMIVVYGESGVGKSFVTLDYAIRASTAGNVLYIPTEGVSGYGKRVAAWCEHHKQRFPNSLFFMRSGINLYDRASVKEKAARLASGKLRLIVIDTLAMSMIGADENSSRDMGIALASCRTLIETLNCSVILVHHMGKSGQSERGSSALRGNADVMIKIAAADDVLSVECTKAKDFEPFPKRYVRLQEVGTGADQSLVVVNHNFTDGERKALTKTQRAIMDTLMLETCAAGVTLRDLSELTSTGLAALHRAVSTLMRKNYVEKGKSGYRLTETGRGMMKLDPVDPIVIQAEPPSVSPHDPVIQRSTENPPTQRKLLGSLDQADQEARKAQYYKAGL